MNRADFITISDEQQKRIEEIREAFRWLYNLVDTNCVSSRETSLSLTKLEEAQFWLIKGITREPQSITDTNIKDTNWR